MRKIERISMVMLPVDKKSLNDRRAEDNRVRKEVVSDFSGYFSFTVIWKVFPLDTCGT
jgi:hypothetical protein